MNPAKEVGGDFYDFFLIDDDHLALVMADVSGKGVPAALFMVIAKTLLKTRHRLAGHPERYWRRSTTSCVKTTRQKCSLRFGLGFMKSLPVS